MNIYLFCFNEVNNNALDFHVHERNLTGNDEEKNWGKEKNEYSTWKSRKKIERHSVTQWRIFSNSVLSFLVKTGVVSSVLR